MFELSDEKILMRSDDGSVTLTSHRVIHDEDGQRQQVMLEDYAGYRFESAHIGHYTVLLVICSVLMLIAMVKIIENFLDTPVFWAHTFSGFLAYLKLNGWLLWLLLPFFILSFLFYRISRRYYLRIDGRFHSIRFRVRHPNSRSTKKFLTAITWQARKIQNPPSAKGEEPAKKRI